MIDRDSIKKEIISSFLKVNESVKFKNIEDWFGYFLKTSLPVMSEDQIKEIKKTFLAEIAKDKTDNDDLTSEESIDINFFDKLEKDLNKLDLRPIILEEEVLALGVVVLKTSKGGALGEVKLNYSESVKLAYALSKILNFLNDYKFGLITKEDLFKNIAFYLKEFDDGKRDKITKNLSVILKTIIEGLNEVVDIYGEIAREIDTELLEKILISDLFESEDNLKETIKIVKEFLDDYYKNQNKPVKNFLVEKFKQYPELFKDENEIKNIVNETVQGVKNYNKEKDKLLQAEKSAATVTSTLELDNMINNFNEALWKEAAGKSDSYQGLHGDIAEVWHTETFNLNAKMQGSDLRAERLKIREPNSPDIVIKNNYGNGEEVAKYQSKYSIDSATTKYDIKERNYSDQKIIVSKDQLEKLKEMAKKDPAFRKKFQELTDRIIVGEVESKSITREEVERLSEKARRKEPIFNWNILSTKDIIKYNAKQTVKSIKFIALFEGIKRISKRISNYFKGEKNPPLEKELKEWMESTIDASVPVATTSIISSGLIIAAKKGLIKRLSTTPPGKIAMIASVAMDNVKIMYKAAKGEIPWRTALPTMAKITTISVASLAGASKGAALGASLGSVIPGIGTLIGGFIGGTIGGLLGSKLGETAYNYTSKAIKEQKTIKTGAVVTGTPLLL